MQKARIFLNVNNIGQSACIATSSLYWGKDAHLFTVVLLPVGRTVAQLVETLRYKP